MPQMPSDCEATRVYAQWLHLPGSQQGCRSPSPFPTLSSTTFDHKTRVAAQRAADYLVGRSRTELASAPAKLWSADWRCATAGQTPHEQGALLH